MNAIRAAARAAYFARKFPLVIRKLEGRLLCVEDVRGGCKGAHWVCRTPDGRLHRSFRAALSHLDNERVLAEQKEALRRQKIVERRIAWEKEQARRQEIRRTVAIFKRNGIVLRETVNAH